MQITNNFTLEELVKSNTAKRLNIPNIPDTESLINLVKLCIYILQPTRDDYGLPLQISSAFRCSKLNTAVGGVPGSYHLKGCAADILVSSQNDARRLASILNKQKYCDVVLWEKKSWIHVQMSEHPRHHINLSYK